MIEEDNCMPPDFIAQQVAYGFSVREGWDTKTQDKEELHNTEGFPDDLYVIEIPEGKHAINQVTWSDGMVLDGIATFGTLAEALKYADMPSIGLIPKSMIGVPKSLKFQEAVDLVKIKPPSVKGLILFEQGRPKLFYSVR